MRNRRIKNGRRIKNELNGKANCGRVGIPRHDYTTLIESTRESGGKVRWEIEQLLARSLVVDAPTDGHRAFDNVATSFKISWPKFNVMMMLGRDRPSYKIATRLSEEAIASRNGGIDKYT